MCKEHKILFIFPKWPNLSVWGHFKYKFPPLGLIAIAGLTPPEFAVEFTDENVSDIDFDMDANLIAISVMTPFPDTHLTKRMETQGRILCKDWSKYDMSTVVYQPKNFTPERLQERYNELNQALYSVGSIARRTLKPRKNMLLFVPQNFGFRNAWRGLERARLANSQA